MNAQEYSVPTLEHMSEHPLECMNGTVFSTFVDVFGVYLVATPEAPKAYVDHSANVLAEYLDNDGDGVPDDKAVTDYLADGNYIMPVWEEEDRDAFFEHPDYLRAKRAAAPHIEEGSTFDFDG